MRAQTSGVTCVAVACSIGKKVANEGLVNIRDRKPGGKKYVVGCVCCSVLIGTSVCKR